MKKSSMAAANAVAIQQSSHIQEQRVHIQELTSGVAKLTADVQGAAALRTPVESSKSMTSSA